MKGSETNKVKLPWIDNKFYDITKAEIFYKIGKRLPATDDPAEYL